jgi:hypothetical protein
MSASVFGASTLGLARRWRMPGPGRLRGHVTPSPRSKDGVVRSPDPAAGADPPIHVGPMLEYLTDLVVAVDGQAIARRVAALGDGPRLTPPGGDQAVRPTFTATLTALIRSSSISKCIIDIDLGPLVRLRSSFGSSSCPDGSLATIRRWRPAGHEQSLITSAPVLMRVARSPINRDLGH